MYESNSREIEFYDLAGVKQIHEQRLINMSMKTIDKQIKGSEGLAKKINKGREDGL